MTNEVTIASNKVLTVSLLNRVNKAAYQYGGFKTKGGFIKKTPNTLDAKTTIIIQKQYIKGNIEKFISDFSKTMNAWYYNIELINE